MKKKLFLFAFIIVNILQSSFLVSDDWYLFETKKYKLSFPGIPIEETRVIDSELGKLKIIAHIFQVTDTAIDKNLLYGLAETEYPENFIKFKTKELIDTFFTHSVNGAVNKVRGKLISVKVCSKDEFPGREIKIDYSNGLAIINMKLYLVKNIMYCLQAITYTANNSNILIDKFMNSFTLKY